MTKKDFELIAGVLKWTQPNRANSSEAQYGQWRWMAQSMCDTLQKNNPRFDHTRFLKACGLQD